MTQGLKGSLRSPNGGVGLEIQDNGNICLVLYKQSDGGKVGMYWCANSNNDLEAYKVANRLPSNI